MMVSASAGGTNHFYIDTSPPQQVRLVLLVLDEAQAMTVPNIRQTVSARYGPAVRRVRSEWPRRLMDLGLAFQERARSSVAYRLTPIGAKLREIATLESDLYSDLMHYRHYSTYVRSPAAREYLWSYRQCSSIAWAERSFPPTASLAAAVLGRMQEQFPTLDFTAARGARFDHAGASRWLRWVGELYPSPVGPDRQLLPRTVTRHELPLLALDDVYQTRGYRYGDPVILDESLLDEIASVFFLDAVCTRELIDRAARLTRAIKLADTFSGTSITLLHHYGIEAV